MPADAPFRIDPVTRVATGPDAFHVPKEEWDRLSRVPCLDCDEIAQLDFLKMPGIHRGDTYQPNGKWTCPNGCHLKRGTNLQ